MKPFHVIATHNLHFNHAFILTSTTTALLLSSTILASITSHHQHLLHLLSSCLVQLNLLSHVVYLIHMLFYESLIINYFRSNVAYALNTKTAHVLSNIRSHCHFMSQTSNTKLQEIIRLTFTIISQALRAKLESQG